MPRPRKHANNADRQAAYRARRLQQGATESALGGQATRAIPSKPGRRRWDAMIREACSIVESAMDEMRTYYDEKSEGWQCSEPGERLAETMDSIEEIAALMRELHYADRNTPGQRIRPSPVT